MTRWGRRFELDEFVIPPPGWERRMMPVPGFVESESREQMAARLAALFGPGEAADDPEADR